METTRSLQYFVTFQPLYIGALSAISFVGTPLVQTQSCSAPKNPAPLLSLALYTSVIFESYPTKIWALISPPSIAGVFKTIWLIASASFRRRRLRARFGHLKCCWRCDDKRKTPSWVVCLKVRQTMFAGTFPKYFFIFSKSSLTGRLILGFKGAKVSCSSVLVIPTLW